MKKANICGARIKKAREQKRMDQVDLAAAMEEDFKITITQSDISEIERGVRGIKDFELDAIAKILQVSPGWLLRGKE